MVRLSTPPTEAFGTLAWCPAIIASSPVGEPEPKPHWFSGAIQSLIAIIHSPKPPGPAPLKPLGRIAIIGAGVTGVSSAAHCVAHGFEVVMFDKKNVTGGVWNDVNSTSSLQLNSWMYRFHPSVVWSESFPKKSEILKQIRALWIRYGLESRTRLNYDVKRVQRFIVSGKTAWSIDDGAEGLFDGIIVAIGTCAQPYDRRWPSREVYAGALHHSSDLDNMPNPKIVAVIGSGASAVEAAEQAIIRGARRVTVIARHDKWIIPRGLLPMGIISVLPWGWSSRVSRFCEAVLRRYHYRNVDWVAPLPDTGYGLDQLTPIVNDDFLQLIRDGSAEYLRGTTTSFVPEGVKVQTRGHLKTTVVKADVVIDATGFERPSFGFLPSTLFPSGYDLPALFLHSFSVDDSTILFTNSVYEEAIGTVGHVHIGVYTRIMMMFLLDPKTAPEPKNMRLWVDIVRYLKSDARAEAFSFFTYLEMFICLIIFHLVQPNRLRWAAFNFFGFGTSLVSLVYDFLLFGIDSVFWISRL
ncbi:hypothetical protein DFH28DRAFT_1084821 [Melampsora americana]|nr:hypothetical protein DFH28DRAFT_1084821 [Melampsora americana]